MATSIQGKGVFPEDHPLWLWCGFGEAAPPFVQKIASGCDLTLAIGCRFAEVGTAGYGVQPAGPLVHVDIDPAVLGRNFPAQLPIVADAAAFVSALLPHLTPRGPDPGLRETIRAGHAEVWKEWVAPRDSSRVYPPHLLKTLQEVVGPDAAYSTDSGNGTFLAMECLRLAKQRSFLAPVDYSCMGYSLPAALGAALACPGRPVVALPGDGAFLMTGLELLTAAQNQLPVMVFVLRDRELAQIAQFQQTVLDRKTCSELPSYDLAALCRGVGVECLALDNNALVEPVVRQALAVAQSRRPVVVDVAIDYSEKTYFTRGVVKVMASRLPLADRVRFIARALGRRFT